jgi:hypothetical protein
VGIWLPVFIGVAQLLLGGMGVYVSLRTPGKENHSYWIAAEGYLFDSSSPNMLWY